MQKAQKLNHRPRLNRPALEKLTPRDIDVLRWTCEQYAANLEHVQAMAGCSEQTARLTIGRLRDAHLITTQHFLVGEPTWLLPTFSGLTAAGLHGTPWNPAISRLAQLAAINRVRLSVEAQRPEALWIGNRQLRNEHPKAPAVRAGYAKYLPDGVGIVAEDSAAFRVELYYKGRPYTEAALDALSRRYGWTYCYCDRLPYGKLLQLKQTGRWPRLHVRPLPGAEWADVAARSVAASTGRR